MTRALLPQESWRGLGSGRLCSCLLWRHDAAFITHLLWASVSHKEKICSEVFFFFFYFLVCIWLLLINNIAIVWGEQQGDSATHRHVSILLQAPWHPGCHITLSRVPCAVQGPCWSSTLDSVLRVYPVISGLPGLCVERGCQGHLGTDGDWPIIPQKVQCKRQTTPNALMDCNISETLKCEFPKWGSTAVLSRLLAEPLATFWVRLIASQRRSSITDSRWQFSHWKPLLWALQGFICLSLNIVTPLYTNCKLWTFKDVNMCSISIRHQWNCSLPSISCCRRPFSSTISQLLSLLHQ